MYLVRNAVVASSFFCLGLGSSAVAVLAARSSWGGALFVIPSWLAGQLWDKGTCSKCNDTLTSLLYGISYLAGFLLGIVEVQRDFTAAELVLTVLVTCALGIISVIDERS